MRNKSMAQPCSPYREWPLTHSTCAFQTGCPPSRWASEMRILRSIARACRRHDSKSVVVKLAIRRTTRKAMRHRTCWTDRWRATRTQKCTSLFGILLGKHSHASTTIGTCCPFRLRIDPPSTNCTMPPYRKRWVNTRTYRSCKLYLRAATLPEAEIQEQWHGRHLSRAFRVWSLLLLLCWTDCWSNKLIMRDHSREMEMSRRDCRLHLSSIARFGPFSIFIGDHYY